MSIDITDSAEFREIIKNSRAKEISELMRMLQYGHVILYGEAGIGKTALLKVFEENNPLAYYNVNFLRGYEVELNESLLLPYLMFRGRRSMAFPDLLIIDGFDEVRSPAIREKVATMIKEGRKFGYRLILSARRQFNEKVFENNARVFRLNGIGETSINALVDIFSMNSNDHPDLILTIREMMHGGNGNPMIILTQLNLLFSTKQDFAYHNPAVIGELEKPTIILEEAPKIITDLRFVNKRILDRIGRQPQEVYHLSARQFEELVAELFEERGYKVELTKQSRDGGKDLIILDHREIGNFMIYAECKRYAPNNPVGVSVVSDLIGRMTADRATAGMVVTSSYFSPDAKVFQSKFENQMKLIDFVKLSSMIETSYS